MFEFKVENNDLISIIVPVYNSEKTLERCVNSICNQSYKNIEVILVNDGSLDSSLSLCNKLLQRDKRIKVISQKNSGVSAARNLGIETSNGKYIGFVDSDDWVDSNMYLSMYECIQKNNAELAFCNYIKVSNNKYSKRDEFANIKGDKNSLKTEILSSLISVNENNIMGSCWKLLVSKKLLYKNNIYFDLGIKMSEDMMFVIKCVDAAKTIALDRECFYFYCLNDDSTTSKYIPNIWEDMMLLINWCRDKLLYKYSDLDLNKNLNECITNAVIAAISNSCKKGTPLNFLERLDYYKSIYRKQYVKNAIKTTWKHKNRFFKKIWPQILCIVFKCDWLVILYHSIKHNTIFIDRHRFKNIHMANLG